MKHRSMFAMFSGSIPTTDIKAAVDENVEGKMNLHIGTLYLTMSFEQFTELVTAGYAAINNEQQRLKEKRRQLVEEFLA